MLRSDWKEFARNVRLERRATPPYKPARWFSFEVNGVPYRATAAHGHTLRILTERLPDRPTGQMIARELNAATEDRRIATTDHWRSDSRKRSAHLSLTIARQWRTTSWRDDARAAAA
jgi:hypothetical protein